MGDGGEREVRRFKVLGDSGGKSSTWESMDRELKMREEEHFFSNFTTGTEIGGTETKGREKAEIGELGLGFRNIT